MSPNTMAFIALCLSAGILIARAVHRRRRASQELARRKARAQARYMDRYRQQEIL
jgi:heme exporter protein D